MNKKNWVIAGVVVVVLVLIYVIGVNLTGNVVWEPATTINTCDDTEIELLWDELFVEEHDGFMVFDATGTSNICDRIAIKIDGSQIWGLEISVNNNSYTYYVNGDPYIVNQITQINGEYINASYDLISEHGTPATLSDIEDIYYFLLNGNVFDNLTFWEVYTEGEASTEFSNLFIVAPGNFNEQAYSFGSDEEDSLSNLIYHKGYGTISKDESIVRYFYERALLEEIGAPTFKKNVSDYLLQIDTSWNNVSNVGEFVSGVYSSVNLSHSGSGGNLTLFDIQNGIIMFNTDNISTGVTTFLLTVYYLGGDIESNEFNVTLVRDINDKPILLKDFDDTLIPAAGKTFDLTKYFEDPEGGALEYNEHGETDNLIITFVNDTMTIKPNGTINGLAKIWVYAEDSSGLDVKSNKFYVFDSSYNSNASSNNNTQNITSTPSAGASSDTSGGSTANASSNSTGTEDGDSEDGNVNWFLWIGILVVMFSGGLFALWYFILRKNTPRPDGGNIGVSGIPGAPGAKAPPTPVGSYLEKLNLGKK